MIELTLGGALALLLVCCIACGMRNTQRMTSALELMEADYQVTLDRVREAEAKEREEQLEEQLALLEALLRDLQ